MDRSILLPLDGSPRGEAVLPYAAALARTERCGLTLLHCVDAPATHSLLGFSKDMAHKHLEQRYDWARSYLQAIARRLSAADLPVSVEVSEDDPGAEILARAKPPDTVAIAMTAYGFSGLRRWALGGVTAKVLHATSVPLLLVRAEEPPPADTIWPRTILVPLDGSLSAEQALPPAQELASATGSAILLLSVVPPLYQMVIPPNEFMLAETKIQLEAQQQHMHAYLNDHLARLHDTGLKARSQVIFNSPAQGILQAAEDAHADLIVLTTHGHTGLGRLWPGSVALKVAQVSHMPVMLVRVRDR